MAALGIGPSSEHEAQALIVAAPHNPRLIPRLPEELTITLVTGFAALSG